LREIVFKKSNYGKVSDSLVLRYHNGLFLPEGGVSGLDKLARDQKAEEIFLSLLARYIGEGRNVSDSAKANNSAATSFAKKKDAKGFRRSDMDAAMRRLFESGKIHVQEYGRPSRLTSRLALGRKMGWASRNGWEP
jgi:hypothetical protein